MISQMMPFKCGFYRHFSLSLVYIYTFTILEISMTTQWNASKRKPVKVMHRKKPKFLTYFNSPWFRKGNWSKKKKVQKNDDEKTADYNLFHFSYTHTHINGKMFWNLTNKRNKTEWKTASHSLFVYVHVHVYL